MATNKRKDAAALFELIEKSTLKVPKGGNGALKIPSWWSSKANPPTVPHSAVESGDAEIAQDQQEQTDSQPRFPEPLTPEPDPFEKIRKEHTRKPEAHDPTVKLPKESLPVDLPPTPSAHQEPNWEELPLPTPDDPEPAEVTPEPAKPTQNTATSHKHIVPPTYASAQRNSPSFSASGRVSGSAYRPPVAVPPTARMAAPSYTSAYAASRIGQNQNIVVVMLESPLWVKASFLAAIVVLIVLIVAFFTSGKSKPPVTGNRGGASVANSDSGQQPKINASGNNTNNTQDIVPEPPQQRAGKVVPASSVVRRGDKYYLVIISFKSQNLANEAAKFAAENGVDDVTVERHREGNSYSFKVISVEGVSQLSSSEADAMRKRIVDVGRTHQESKKFHKGIFDDAYFAVVKRGS